MNQASIQQIIDLLIKAYGDREEKLNTDPIAELVRTILSQNTSDHNSYQAFGNLKTIFKSWEQVLNSSPKDISKAIYVGGLSEVKAHFIKKALSEIKHLRGDLNLYFLKQLDVGEARKWLVQLPGVGMKTASCVLLFSLGMPAFPVDTHVWRVSGRLGLISRKISRDQAHLLLEKITPGELTYKAHVLLIEHGRRTCKSQRPLCRQCVLQHICPSYDKCIAAEKGC